MLVSGWFGKSSRYSAVVVQRFAAVVVRDLNGRVLLGLREDFAVWGLPGGHIEPGETLEQAAVRETLEECGVEVAIEALVGCYIRTRSGTDGESSVFAASVVSGEPCADGVETREVGWFHPAQLPVDMVWWHKTPIADAVAGRSDVIRRIDVRARHGSMSREQVYALRDASGLSRRVFFHAEFPEPDHFEAALGAGDDEPSE